MVRLNAIHDVLRSMDLDFKIAYILLIIIIAVALIVSIHKLRSNDLMSSISHGNKRAKTISHVIVSTMTMIIVVVALLLILSSLGINVKAYAAGLGIASVIVGLALQDYLSDIVRGIELALDGVFNIDDYLIVNGIDCKVVAFDLRKTTFYGLMNDTTIVLYNSQIKSIQLMSDYVDIPVPIGLEVSYYEAQRRLAELIPKVSKLPPVTYVELLDANRLTEASVEYLLRVHGDMKWKQDIQRNALDILVKHFEDNGYEFGRETRFVIK